LSAPSPDFRDHSAWGDRLGDGAGNDLESVLATCPLPVEVTRKTNVKLR
jgi:hypothetical protein